MKKMIKIAFVAAFAAIAGYEFMQIRKQMLCLIWHWLI